MFAGIYFWYPKMYGRMMNETLGKLHSGSLITINLTFGGQMIVGYSGQQRRLYEPYQYAYAAPCRTPTFGPAWRLSP